MCLSWQETICTSWVGPEGSVLAGLHPRGTLLLHLQAPGQGHPAQSWFCSPGGWGNWHSRCRYCTNHIYRYPNAVPSIFVSSVRLVSCFHICRSPHLRPSPEAAKELKLILVMNTTALQWLLTQTGAHCVKTNSFGSPIHLFTGNHNCFTLIFHPLAGPLTPKMGLTAV